MADYENRWIVVVLVLFSAFFLFFVSLLLGMLLVVITVVIEIMLRKQSKNKKIPKKVVKVKCPKCGTLNEEDAKYCKKCAKAMTRKDIETAPKKTNNGKQPLLIGILLVGFFVILGIIWVASTMMTNPTSELSSPLISIPSRIEIYMAEPMNWDSEAEEDGIRVSFKVFDSGGRQIAVNGHLRYEILGKCTDLSTWTDYTKGLQNLTTRLYKSDFSEMSLMLTGSPLGLLAEKDFEWSSKPHIPSQCYVHEGMLELIVGDKTYSDKGPLFLV
jgi:uncharacterized protein (DUF983 family)